jgi:uncharacterized cupredoxin-like copper-binding protein
LNTTENQLGVNAQGTPVSGGLEARADFIRKTIHEGRPNTVMPAWGEENGGPLNDEQIEELVTMIQHVDWNEVYNEAVTAAGGYPAAPPAKTAESTATSAPAEPNTYHVEMVDTAFVETNLVVPANTDITINVTNTGVGAHTFDIDELDVHSGEVAAGDSKTLTFNTGSPAEYEYYCAVPGHREAGMVGKLTVPDDPSLLPAAAPASASPAEGAPADEPAADGAATTQFDVSMTEMSFSVPELVVPANSEITINLTNSGVSEHNFTVTELNATSGNVPPGETRTFTFNSGAPGEYQFFCSIPGHKEAGMVGKLIVQ